MRQSEQLETRIVLAANADAACGLLIQRLPIEGAGNLAGKERAELDEEAYTRIAHFASTLTATELLTLDTPTILHRLFWEEPLRVFRAAGADVSPAAVPPTACATCSGTWAARRPRRSWPNARTSRSAATSAASSTASTRSTSARCSRRRPASRVARPACTDRSGAGAPCSKSCPAPRNVTWSTFRAVRPLLVAVCPRSLPRGGAGALQCNRGNLPHAPCSPVHTSLRDHEASVTPVPQDARAPTRRGAWLLAHRAPDHPSRSPRSSAASRRRRSRR